MLISPSRSARRNRSTTPCDSLAVLLLRRQLERALVRQHWGPATHTDRGQRGRSLAPRALKIFSARQPNPTHAAKEYESGVARLSAPVPETRYPTDLRGRCVGVSEQKR